MRLKNRILRTTMLSLAVAAIAAAGAMPASAAEGKAVVNINTAGVEQLALLPRVGASVAQRIVDFRQKNGRFETVEDLMLVRGIGEKTYELIAPHVTLSGDTTLSEKVRTTSSSEKGSED